MEIDLRKLLYQNVSCGVAPEAAARALGLSEEKAADIFAEVGKKLGYFQIREAMPYVLCQTIQHARQNRKALLPILDKLDLDAPDIVRVVRVKESQQRQVPQ